MSRRPHKHLEVWKRGIDFVTAIYSMTDGYPDEEQYGLVSQMRRAAQSIPTNIAEGAARQTPAEFRNFLYNSSGSISELDTLLEISTNVEMLDAENKNKLQQELSEISAMIAGLIEKQNKKIENE